MRFWDSSALVPLAVQEARSVGVRTLMKADPVVVVWWGTRVECASALARRRREGLFSIEGEAQARRVLEELLRAAAEVPATESVREYAVRLVRVHSLHAADALQLGAALVWANGALVGREIITLDERLGEAASREGFTVRSTFG